MESWELKAGEREVEGEVRFTLGKFVVLGLLD